MAREADRATTTGMTANERDAALRPRWLREVIGQKAVVQRLGIVLNACTKLKEPLSHILFDGPPGLGKTTFATVLPNELGTSIQMTSGPALSKPADLLPFLTNVEEGSFLFIDEIHRMPRVVEEFIYPAMEDFRIDIILGEGINARTISMKLKHFTLIGATTRSGMLSEPDARPLQDARAPGVLHASRSWPRSSASTPTSCRRRSPTTPRWNWPAAAGARRASPTPGCGGRAITPPARPTAGSRWTSPGPPWPWPRSMRRDWTSRIGVIWKRLIGVFDGGPTGVEALAATMNLPADTLSDEIEPYLLREQFIVRTPRGRVATPRSVSAARPRAPEVRRRRATGAV